VGINSLVAPQGTAGCNKNILARILMGSHLL
jgi:hypothetical protein